MEVIQNRDQYRAVELAVFNLKHLVPENYFN